MQRKAWLVAAACGALSVAAACAIDESGLQGTDEGGVDTGIADMGVMPDSGAPDVAFDAPLPPACRSIDLSCIGFDDGGLPDGWSPYVIELDGGACPSGDFTGTSWFTNARLSPGACTCSCTPSGTWTCPNTGTINVSTGPSCMTTAFTVDAGACQIENPQSSHMELTSTMSATSNGVACAPDGSAPAEQADPVTLCASGCDAGSAYCAQPSGTRCIAADTPQMCPPTFTPHTVGAGVTGSCNSACTCSPNSAPACSASATVYYGYPQNVNAACSTSGSFSSQTFALDGTCKPAMGNFDSFSVSWNAPSAPTCNSSGAGGDAGLTAVKTICCK